MQRQPIERHIELKATLIQQQFLAIVSAPIDHLSANEKVVFFSIFVLGGEQKNYFTARNEVIMTRINGRRISPAAFVAAVTFSCTLVNESIN